MTAGSAATPAFGLAAAATWGAGDFTGGIATRSARAYLVVAIAHGLSLVLLVLLTFALHSPLPAHRTVFWGWMTGIAGGIALIVFYKALSLAPMGLTAALTGLLTALLPVLFAFFTQGLPGPSQLTGFLVAGAAIWLIAASPGSSPRTSPKSPPRSSPESRSASGSSLAHAGQQRRALILATIAGIGFGLFLVALKLAGEGGVLWPLACSRMSSTAIAVVALVGARVRDGRDRERPAGQPRRRPAPRVLLLAALAGVLDTAGNLLYTLATRSGRLDVSAVLSSLYPAGTILLAVWLLKERTTRAQAAGMALALVAVVLISL